MIRKNTLLSFYSIVIASLAFGAISVQAAELKIFGAIAMQEITADLAPKFERATGHKLVVVPDTLGGILKRIEGVKVLI